MCGIAGMLHQEGLHEDSAREALNRMIGRSSYRGPGDRASWIDSTREDKWGSPATSVGSAQFLLERGSAEEQLVR
jgi:asparagine synthetase B (glutamine-hydrolysing)